MLTSNTIIATCSARNTVYMNCSPILALVGGCSWTFGNTYYHRTVLVVRVPKPIGVTHPASFRVYPLWCRWNVAGSLTRFTVFPPFSCRFQTKSMDKGASLVEGSTPTARNPATAEPITHSNPTHFFICLIRHSRNIVRLLARFAILRPFRPRFQTESARKGAGCLERSILS